MSDLTYGYVQNVTDLVWGPPVRVSQRHLAQAIRAGYNLVWTDLSGLVMPPLARVECSTHLAQVNSSIHARASLLARTCGVAQPASRVTAHAQPATLSAALHSAAATNSLNAAPRQVSQVHDLLGRTEWSLARGQALVPDSPLVAAVRQRLGQADTAVARGDLAAANQMAEDAMATAAQLDTVVERAVHSELAQSRIASEALARAGALWTALAGHEDVAAWVGSHASAEVLAAGEELARARTAYAERRFTDAGGTAHRLGAELSGLLDRAQDEMAANQRDQMAVETAKVLADRGYAITARLDGVHQVVEASRHGRLVLTVSYDLEGRFKIDSRKGFGGSAKCAVEVNALLEALKERMTFEIEGRQFAGAADDEPGRTARTSSVRRRLTASDLLDDVASRDPVPARQQQLLAAAWSRVKG